MAIILTKPEFMKITIIGSGNVGTALAKRIFSCGHLIHQIYSRELAKAETLANAVNAAATDDIKRLDPESDIYILAVNDDAISAVSNIINPGKGILAHTSGATSLRVFEGKHSNYGVFYPLQTFSANLEPDFEELPLCVTGSNSNSLENLAQLAKSICPNVYIINEEQRKGLHVAAVFVNNFSNFLFSAAYDICEKENLDFNMLKPLIRQTIRKIETEIPGQVQTGPAARGDEGTIFNHLAWLEEHNPDLSPIYKMLTTSILNIKRLKK